MPRLFIADGAKALSKSIRRTFGSADDLVLVAAIGVEGEGNKHPLAADSATNLREAADFEIPIRAVPARHPRAAGQRGRTGASTH